MIFHLYPNPPVVTWLSLSLIGFATNLILVWVARRGHVYARTEGGNLYEYALIKFGRMVMRMGIHIANFSLGMVGLLTPPSPAPPARIAWLAIFTIGCLYMAHLLVVTDGLIELYSVQRSLHSKEGVES